MTMSSIVHLSVLFLLGWCSNFQDDNWGRFRGPGGGGVATKALSLPSQWSVDEHLAWKTSLPGPGASSPIIVGDKVFVTCYSGYGGNRRNPGDIEDLIRHLICLDLHTGKILWDRKVKARLPEDLYDQSGVSSHGYASHTPASDGARVFCYFGKSGVHAFDLDGNALWTAQTGGGSDPPKWGSSSSPIVFKDTLIVTASAESKSVLGFDVATGRKKWAWESEELNGMWGTPSLVAVDEQRVDLVMMIPGKLLGIDPNDGTLRWQFGSMPSQQAYTSIIHQKNRVFAFAGQPGGSVALDLYAGETAKATTTVWTGQVGATYASPVRHQDKIYVVSRGLLTCVDADSGKQLSKQRIKAARRVGNNRFGSLDYASPVVAGDRLFWLNASGQLFVFQLGEEIKWLATKDLSNEKGEVFWGTPAISNDRIVIRSSKGLYCLSGSK